MNLSLSMVSMGTSVAVALLVGAGFAVGACSSSDGATSIAGPPGPAGPPGTATSADGGTITSLPTSCLSPCHGFAGVVPQYQTSTHFMALAQFASTEGETWTATGNACGNCHAIDAIEQRLAGNVGTVAGGKVTNLATGELQYKNPTTGALATSTYAGNAVVAQVYCTTCHAVTEANDPHKTGIPWTPGSFPLRVSATTTTLEKSPTNASVVGTQTSSATASYAAGTTCMMCHRSRVDITNYLTDTNNKLANVHWGPHEGPQSDVFTGKGGYEYATKTYAQSTHAQKLTCTSCHMVAVSGNSDVPDHSFSANITACKNCHAGATTFDVNGGEASIKAALTEIETYLNGQGWLTRSEASPYPVLANAEVGDGNWPIDYPNPSGPGITALTRDQAGAFYNYILVARGGAYGIHNPIYVRQLLWDSYFALAGKSLAAIPARP